MELDYRSGAYTLVELGKLHGIGKSRVHEIAVRHGWKRDLRARIAIAAAAKLSEHDIRLVTAAIEAERAAEDAAARAISKAAGTPNSYFYYIAPTNSAVNFSDAAVGLKIVTVTTELTADLTNRVARGDRALFRLMFPKIPVPVPLTEEKRVRARLVVG